MGRDFFDIVYLSGKARPNYAYLQAKVGIRDAGELKGRLLDRCRRLDFRQLALDVEPFLYAPGDAKKVVLFPEFLEEWGHRGV